MAKIRIGVTGTGSLFGQAIIKSIQNSNLSKDISIVGFDYFNNTVGSYWVDKNIILPDFLKQDVSEEMWLKKVIESLQFEDIRFLFIGIDFELRLFATYKEKIESQTKCKAIVSDPQVIRIADDKYLTYKFLKDNGFYYPETVLPNEVGSSKINFPCVVKPRYGSRSRDVFIVKNEQEMQQRIYMIKNPIIQELIGNPEKEYTCGVIFFDNTVKETITLRRVLKDGNTVIAHFGKNTPNIIYEYLCAVSMKLKPYGACNFQLRLNDKGIPKIFEINARHSGTTYIRALFGFNEVEYILAYFLGIELKKFNLKEGLVKRYYDEMFIGAE